jgi:hypothetical protein
MNYCIKSERLMFGFVMKDGTVNIETFQSTHDISAEGPCSRQCFCGRMQILHFACGRKVPSSENLRRQKNNDTSNLIQLCIDVRLYYIIFS